MGRYSNAKRAEIAAKAAAKAAEVAQAAMDNETPAVVDPPQPDPSAPEFKPINPKNNPRDAAMEEIIARHEKGGEAAPEPEPAPEPAPAAVAAPESPPAAVAVPIPEPPPAAEPIKVVKVKVDGEEFEVPQSDVDAAGGVTAYQIQRASDNRLKKTNEALAETKRVQAQIAQWVAQQVPQQAKPSDAEFMATSIEAIRFGTPEQASSALSEIMARGTQKVDPQQIMSQVVIQVRRQSAADKFNQDFTEIASNPTLMRFANIIENDMLAEFQRNGVTLAQFAAFDWNKFYGIIGNQVRSVIGRPSQPVAAPTAAPAALPSAPAAPTTSPPSQQSDKEARKASIVTLPTAAARAQLPEEPKPETREDTLNEMRKRRGQPTG